jgi:hypothetical protein
VYVYDSKQVESTNEPAGNYEKNCYSGYREEINRGFEG